MLKYRPFLAVVAACVIASPVFAANTDANSNPANAPTIAANTTTQTDTTTTTTTTTETRVNLNHAKAKELLNVKGLNPGMARSIVIYRKKHGNFKSLNDLAKVRGFHKLTPAQLQAIQDQLSL